MRLLFISNLFPDATQPYRGLDNATLLHALREKAEIRAVALRPVLPWSSRHWRAREIDQALAPQFIPVRYIPRVGHRWNHRLYARSMRRAIAAIAKEWPFETILTSWLYPDACAVSRLAEGRRFVAIAQGSDVHQYLRIPARREIITTHLESAAAIVTRSAELARLLGDAGLAQERLHPVYNGVDTETFRPATTAEREASRLELGLPTRAPTLLFVGNFLPVKDPALLLAAFHRVTQILALREARLVLVGGGPLEDELRKRAAAKDLRVIFAGRRDASGVASAMRAADALVLSSKNEGVPNVVLEAFAAGLPVIAPRVGGIHEVLTEETLGTLVDPGDESALAEGIKHVLLRPNDRERIVTHGRSFSWQTCANRYFQFLSRAAK